jgi:hypothetical protein
MKLIFFNNERKVTNEINMIINPLAYGFNEIMWDNGGYADFSDRYVIVDENVRFENVSEEEIFKQYKNQAKIEIAKQLEKNRIFSMASGTFAEKEAEFSKDNERINNANSEEELSIILEEILPKYKH